LCDESRINIQDLRDRHELGTSKLIHEAAEERLSMIRDEEAFNVEFESSAQEWVQRFQTFMVISKQEIAMFR
jgi:hypothetical protein